MKSSINTEHLKTVLSVMTVLDQIAWETIWFNYAAYKTWPIWIANKNRWWWPQRSDGNNNDDRYWQRRDYV